MRFDFTFYADNWSEYKDALTHLWEAIPETRFALTSRGFSVVVTPTGPPVTGLFEQVPVALAPEPVVPQTNGTAPPVSQRKRRTKAEMEAAVSPPPNPPPSPSPPGPDIHAPPYDDPEEAEDEPEDDLENDDPVAAKEEALVILRAAYTAAGGPAAVKALQKEYDVEKFAQVPDEQGLALLARAKALQASLA